MRDENEAVTPPSDNPEPREDTWGERGADWLPGRQTFNLAPVSDQPASPGGLVGTDTPDSATSSAAPQGGAE